MDGIQAEGDRSANNNKCNWGEEFHIDMFCACGEVKNEEMRSLFVFCEIVR
jgi:hypothetical protein